MPNNGQSSSSFENNAITGKLDIINGQVLLHIPHEIVSQLPDLEDQQKIKLQVVDGQLLISI